MKSVLKISLIAAVLIGGTVSAEDLAIQSLFSRFFVAPAQAVFAVTKTSGALGWKVGDSLNFSIQLKPLPQKGTMTMKVTADTKEGILVTESVNVSILKQNIEILFDHDTGAVKKMTVNGKPQDIPDASGIKLVSSEEARITVPAGTYDCIHMVTEDADHQEAQVWLNPAAVPLQGILKTKSAAGQFLEVNTELLSFARGN